MCLHNTFVSRKSVSSIGNFKTFGHNTTCKPSHAQSKGSTLMPICGILGQKVSTFFIGIGHQILSIPPSHLTCLTELKPKPISSLMQLIHVPLHSSSFTHAGGEVSSEVGRRGGREIGLNNQENETTSAEHSHANYSMAQVKFVYYTLMLELHAIKCKYDYIHIIETLILPWKPQDCVWLVIAAHISHSNIEPLAACCKCHLIILSLLPRPYGVGKQTSYLLLTSHVCEWLHHN